MASLRLLVVPLGEVPYQQHASQAYVSSKCHKLCLVGTALPGIHLGPLTGSETLELSYNHAAIKDTWAHWSSWHHGTVSYSIHSTVPVHVHPAYR